MPIDARRPRRARTNVLVIAPHPDDDVIGCGATLARLARRGARIGVTYITDGSASHPNSKRFPPPVLAAVREDEARAALRRLGIAGDLQFLRAADSALAAIGTRERDAYVAAVAARIDTLRAHIVFAPCPRDPHPDHVASTAIVQDALERCRRRPALYFYGVWLTVRGAAADRPDPAYARVRNIRLAPYEVDRKRAAILEHRSQVGALIDDDPAGFVIDAELLATWLTPCERFYRRDRRDRHPGG